MVPPLRRRVDVPTRSFARWLYRSGERLLILPVDPWKVSFAPLCLANRMQCARGFKLIRSPQQPERLRQRAALIGQRRSRQRPQKKGPRNPPIRSAGVAMVRRQLSTDHQVGREWRPCWIAWNDIASATANPGTGVPLLAVSCMSSVARRPIRPAKRMWDQPSGAAEVSTQ